MYFAVLGVELDKCFPADLYFPPSFVLFAKQTPPSPPHPQFWEFIAHVKDLSGPKELHIPKFWQLDKIQHSSGTCEGVPLYPGSHFPYYKQKG